MGARDTRTPLDARSDSSQRAATCGTCAHRDCQGVCQERRSAWHSWRVDGAHRGCYFYSRRPLPRRGIGLADEPAEDGQ